MFMRLPVVKTIQLLLGQTGRLQKFIDRPGITHEFCNEQALKIIEQDGCSACAHILAPYKNELNLGVIWADRDWKNVGHYYVPSSGGGLWRFSNALEDYKEYFYKAVLYARDKDYKQAAFFLGAAAHLVQDMCVPHHARGILFKGHKQFESWAEQKRQLFAVENLGIYKSDNILLHNALVSADLFSLAASADTNSYQKAVEILLPLSQRTTAGLFQYFYDIMRGRVIYKIAAA